MGYAWSNFGKKNNRRLQPKKLVLVATATVSVLLFGRIQGEVKDSLRRKTRKFGNSEQVAGKMPY